MTTLVRGQFVKLFDDVQGAQASAADIVFPDGIANKVTLKAERDTGADLAVTVYKFDAAGVATAEKVTLTNAALTAHVTDAGKTHNLEKVIDVEGYAAIRLAWDGSTNDTSIWAKAD